MKNKTIALIVAMDENRAIGYNNDLPWHLPDDFAMFKRTTLHKPIIMGRKTYESLGKPLPKRLNIVISSTYNAEIPKEVKQVGTLAEAIQAAENDVSETIFIIGGGVVFTDAIKIANKLYITEVHTKVARADTWFPAFSNTDFKLVQTEHHQADDKHNYAFDFQVWDRTNY